MENPGDEDDWHYCHDFVRDDQWYTHTPTPLTFVRRKLQKRRLVFSLVAYEEWKLEPAQARNRTDSEFNETHENWNLIVPPSSSLFVGTTSLYIDATFATLGYEEERERTGIVPITHVVDNDVAGDASASTAFATGDGETSDPKYISDPNPGLHTSTPAETNTSTNNHVEPISLDQLIINEDINMCSLRTIDIEL